MGLGLRHKLRKFLLNVPSFHELIMSLKSRRQIFAKVYENETPLWGSDESRSGIGSELGATSSVRTYLPDLFQRLGVKTFLDAPCGDWNWMRHVDLSNVNYIGADVVPSLIESHQANYSRSGVQFILADLTRDELPQVDLVMCRDCLIHLSFQDIAAVLESFRRTGAMWLLVSNSPHVTVNENKFTGLDWRFLNLRQPPFNFPPAIEAQKDHYSDTPFEITLWKMADLPIVKL